jgi:hypothetical protein
MPVGSSKVDKKGRCPCATGFVLWLLWTHSTFASANVGQAQGRHPAVDSGRQQRVLAPTRDVHAAPSPWIFFFFFPST